MDSGDFNPGRAQLVLKIRGGFVRLRCAAHEDVDGGIAFFGPGMDRDMGLGQQQHSGHTAMTAELVKAAGQNGPPGGPRGPGQSAFNPRGICQPLTTIMVNQNMCASRGSFYSHARRLWPN